MRASALGARSLCCCFRRGVCQDCREFKAGRCSRGDNCRFNHVGGPPPPPEGGYNEGGFEEEGDRRARYNDDDRAYDDDDEDVRLPSLSRLPRPKRVSDRATALHVSARATENYGRHRVARR